MDKARRQEITKLKHKKRCKVFGIKPEEYFCYKEQGTPCSCHLCSGDKFKRKLKHKGDSLIEE